MAGGQGFVAAAGTVVGSVTVALVGLSIACSAGSVTPNNDNVVPLTGQAISVQQQTIAPSWAQALTGGEITSAAGTLGLTLRPTDIAGQAITTAAGIVTPQGSGVTVNITGVEATFEQGFVQGGTGALSGSASTSAIGSVTPSLTLALVGAEVACVTGNVTPEQEAVDVFIASGQGNVGATVAVALAGAQIDSQQGAVGITGDVTLPLTGEAAAFAAGSVEYNRQQPLVGSAITSAQYNVGAPGGATLTGQAVQVLAGTVYTTNDRDFALTGLEITAQAGITFASSLAFVTGQELVMAQEGIGPRTVELVGLEIVTAQGDMRREGGDAESGGGWPVHKPKKKRPVEPVEPTAEVVEVVTPDTGRASLDDKPSAIPNVLDALEERERKRKAKRKKAEEDLLLL